MDVFPKTRKLGCLFQNKQGLSCMQNSKQVADFLQILIQFDQDTPVQNIQLFRETRTSIKSYLNFIFVSHYTSSFFRYK